MHILGSRGFGIDEIAAAFATLDLPGDLNIIIIVEFSRRDTSGVVQVQRDFCEVTRWPLIGSGKDQVIHLAAAHLACVALTHDPAQPLNDI